jgi:hypothetical protein
VSLFRALFGKRVRVRMAAARAAAVGAVDMWAAQLAVHISTARSLQTALSK